MLPHQVLQASLVGQRDPHPMGSSTRSLKGQCRQGLWTGVVTPPTTRLSPSQALLQVCSLGPADRPAGNGGRESSPDDVLWDFRDAPFCAVLSK